MSGIAGILLALGLLIYLAYRGLTVLILAPVLALLAVVFSGGVPFLASYTQVFMGALGRFVILYFPLFLLGAIFGKLMDDSGSAKAIAHGLVRKLGSERSILAVVLACAVLTYGGVSLFVVAFAIFPIADALFREAQIPKRLIPAAIALGAFTFTMTALPGTPAIQNAIPMPYFGTTPFAAPGLGIISGAVMLALGGAWLAKQARRARLNAEGYGEPPEPERLPRRELREHAQGEGFDLQELHDKDIRAVETPSFVLATAPIVLVIGLNYGFTTYVIPSFDASYLARPEYGATTLASVRGIWSIISALVLASLAIVVLNRHNIVNAKQSLDSGANASLVPIFNTASMVGFGAVIASLPAFETIRDAVLGIGGFNPLVSLALSVNILAGITGSASGGMSIALQTLGETYVEMAAASGISMELMHRVTTIATGGLDSLPHNGAVITLLAICKLGHRDAYTDIFVVALVIPIIALVLVITLGSVFGSF